MAHFATTALIRKRVVEKRSEKHIAKTLKIHEKVMKIHVVFCTRFGPNFPWILTSFLGHFPVKKVEKPLPEEFLEFHVFRH